MATSGSKSVTVATGLTLKFSWSQSSQSVANNTTTISWTLQVIYSSGYSMSSSASKAWEVTVNGTKYTGSNTLPSSGTKTMGSGSTTITHSSDGTKTFSYSFSQTFGVTWDGKSISSGSGSGSGTLETIARASSVSGGSGNIGASTTITISRASSSFTHTLTYTFGSLSGTIATKTTSTSVSWTIPTSFYAQVTTAKSKTGTIKCETFNGSTSIGSKSISFTATVTGSEPTLSPKAEVASDSVTASLTGSTTKFIKGFTTVTVSTGASAKNSATITSQKIVNGSTTINSGSGTISNIQNGTFSFSVTDSRGYTKSSVLTRTIVDYVSPSISWSSISIDTNGNLSLKVTGKCFNGSFGSVTNTIKVQWQYKQSGGSWSGWKDMTITRSGNNYTATGSGTGYDTKKTYVFKAWIGDKFYDLGQNSGVYTAEKSGQCLPVFDWGETDFNFNVDVKAEGYIWAKSHMYTNGQMKFQHSPSQYARLGYYTDDEVDCTFISNGANNWLRLGDDGTLKWRGYDVLTSNGTQTITGGLYCGKLSDSYYCTAYKRYNSVPGNIMSKIGISYVGAECAMAIEVGKLASDGETFTAQTRYRFAVSSLSTSTNNVASLGLSDKKWTAVYATNGTIQTSDGRYKYILEDIDSQTCYDLIKDMNLYGYSTLNKRMDEYVDMAEISDELQESSQEDMNLHMGFVAQEIEDSELAKYILIKDDFKDKYGRPTGEYIFGVDNYAYTTAIHGALQHEIELRDKQIDELEERIAKLEEQLGVE